MPHVFALVIAGAGLYAGYKWVSRMLADAEDAARLREAELREAMARGQGMPKDLGTLEYDPATGVYRPRSQ
ncbi:hypothetical protein [Hyphomicrobium sp.]|uniref:hypothetical protein n=1 Tax=Hyphomicrobium sp. TaxID=82 RepID=UPI0025BA27FB|nr:hypothetical protein [Hyphomicrobium sp.]MCC7250650.1 hypothetical protein [Hyphomicrobium sp.]